MVTASPMRNIKWRATVEAVKQRPNEDESMVTAFITDPSSYACDTDTTPETCGLSGVEPMHVGAPSINVEADCNHHYPGLNSLGLLVGELTMEPDFEQECNELREALKRLEDRTRALMNHSKYDKGSEHDGECRGQTMLAVRHIEDARMRVGKILQYADDGVSILDKPSA